MKTFILYFSGTGNTKLISERMEQYFNKTIETELIPVEDILNGRIHLDFSVQENLFGIGFPIYDLSSPKIINQLVASLPHAKKPVPIFIFSTMAFIKGDCHSLLAKELKKKGYYTIGKTDFLCPSNGVAIYEKKSHGRYKNVRFEKNIDKKIMQFTNDIVNSFKLFKQKPFHKSGPTFLIFNLVRSISDKLYGDKYYKNLAISEDCTLCGICVNQCHDNNLIVENEKIKVINDNGCMRCLKCVANCPKKAINFTSSLRYGNYNKSMIDQLYQEANQ